MKDVLSYESRDPRTRQRYVDAAAVWQFVICFIFSMGCLPLIDILLHGSGPGVGGGLVCIDSCLLLTLIVNIVLTVVKPRARLRRVSSYCSWAVILLYAVLSVVVAKR